MASIKFYMALCIYMFVMTIKIIAQETPYELHGKNYSATYDECIQYYKQLDKKFGCIQMQEFGLTDAGFPLHLVTLNKSRNRNPENWHQEKKVVILVNNGIHPGEPDGIDASMMLIRDLAQAIEAGEDEFSEDVVLAIIPVYNIGGCLERSEFHRPDQDGPESFGERGNSQYLDLNRDFIKCDSREARSFAEIFQWLDPDVFIDNHVSDGADYQHVMTLASTHHQKLGLGMGAFLESKFEPALYQMMKQKGFPMVPYVNVWGKDPKAGWNQFFDSPRYSAGYAALFQTFGFTIETHMLKPYEQRVKSTYELMKSILEFSAIHRDSLLDIRRQARKELQTLETWPLNWRLNEKKYKEIEFSGYESKIRTSAVSGLQVKYYDHNRPYTQAVKFYNQLIPENLVQIPQAYILPQAWWRVIELLKLNGVEMEQLKEDQVLDCEFYKIKDYKSSASTSEGHHINTQVELDKYTDKIKVYAGDYLIKLNQRAKRFILEVLEPQAGDSYFSWNFFDPILIQKEGYSDYAFEDIAAKILQENPTIFHKLDSMRKMDTAFAQSASEQLEFVYQEANFSEKRLKRYPVLRIMQPDWEKSIPLKSTQHQPIWQKQDE